MSLRRRPESWTGIDFLAQGTIYPDMIESGTKTVKAVKSHHNVGGLPDDLDFELVEPLQDALQGRGARLGLALGLPDSLVYRQPFPGPGLAVRCLGEITRTACAARARVRRHSAGGVCQRRPGQARCGSISPCVPDIALRGRDGMTRVPMTGR